MLHDGRNHTEDGHDVGLVFSDAIVLCIELPQRKPLSIVGLGQSWVMLSQWLDFLQLFQSLLFLDIVWAGIILGSDVLEEALAYREVCPSVFRSEDWRGSVNVGPEEV